MSIDVGQVLVRFYSKGWTGAGGHLVTRDGPAAFGFLSWCLLGSRFLHWSLLYGLLRGFLCRRLSHGNRFPSIDSLFRARLLRDYQTSTKVRVFFSSSSHASVSHRVCEPVAIE